MASEAESLHSASPMESEGVHPLSRVDPSVISPPSSPPGAVGARAAPASLADGGDGADDNDDGNDGDHNDDNSAINSTSKPEVPSSHGTRVRQESMGCVVIPSLPFA